MWLSFIVFAWYNTEVLPEAVSPGLPYLDKEVDTSAKAMPVFAKKDKYLLICTIESNLYYSEDGGGGTLK